MNKMIPQDFFCSGFLRLLVTSPSSLLPHRSRVHGCRCSTENFTPYIKLITRLHSRPSVVTEKDFLHKCQILLGRGGPFAEWTNPHCYFLPPPRSPGARSTMSTTMGPPT